MLRNSIIIKLPKKINSFDIRGQSNLIAAPEWKRALPRAKNMPPDCFYGSCAAAALSSPAFPFGSGGTPEGTRYTKEHPAETPDGNSPLDCCILLFESLLLRIQKRCIPKGIHRFWYECSYGIFQKTLSYQRCFGFHADSLLKTLIKKSFHNA